MHAARLVSGGRRVFGCVDLAMPSSKAGLVYSHFGQAGMKASSHSALKVGNFEAENFAEGCKGRVTVDQAIEPTVGGWSSGVQLQFACERSVAQGVRQSKNHMWL